MTRLRPVGQLSSLSRDKAGMGCGASSTAGLVDSPRGVSSSSGWGSNVLPGDLVAQWNGDRHQHRRDVGSPTHHAKQEKLPFLSEDTPAPIARISAGIVRGYIDHTTHTNAFYAVPFAMAPLFEEAMAVQPWDGVLDATKTSNAAQTDKHTTDDSDVLTVNIWSPFPLGPDQKLHLCQRTDSDPLPKFSFNDLNKPSPGAEDSSLTTSPVVASFQNRTSSSSSSPSSSSSSERITSLQFRRFQRLPVLVFVAGSRDPFTADYHTREQTRTQKVADTDTDANANVHIALPASTATAFIDGGALAKRGNVLVVCVSYRQHGFGFLHNPDSDLPANLGRYTDEGGHTYTRI